MRTRSTTLLGALALAGSYPALLRRRVLEWGATETEAAARLPGDELLEDAQGVSTRAIGIDAPAAAVWPWLVQMGPSPRGGAYTYDWIENLLGLHFHSVDRVLPQFQDPRVGDTIAFGPNRMRLRRIERERALVFCSEDRNWVWAFVLEERAGSTRLISRNRFRLPTLGLRIGMLPMEPLSLVMERKMLRGIKQRAEKLAAEATAGGTRPPTESGARADADTRVELLWIPLGAGGSVVRLSGRAFETVSAVRDRRHRSDLYHCALRVVTPEAEFVIEVAPSPDAAEAGRGVVVTGPVGSRGAGRLRIFRYEVRRWRDGVIADLDSALATSGRLLSDDEAIAARLLDLVPSVPTATWGRDELRAGEMWTSNSVISWLLARSGLPAAAIELPSGGAAPGWRAGLVVADRAQRRQTSSGVPGGEVAQPPDDSTALGTADPAAYGRSAAATSSR